MVTKLMIFIYPDVDTDFNLLQTSSYYCNSNNILPQILSAAVPCKEWQEGESVFCNINSHILWG